MNESTPAEPDYLGTATYSPEDNKLRFYPFARLSKPDYERARAAGFGWAPKQELFVAPMWTPKREDLLTEWCGEIGDEDKSLVERAEERAERFEDYSESRSDDAERAHSAVASIADGIPLGQPILVGHHSERRARKDAERIESGMRRAVKMWEQSKYWEQRAAGAVRAAKYKELPAVRARRIKGIEADQRKSVKNREECELIINAFTRPDKALDYQRALCICNDGRVNFSRCYTLAEFPRQLPASQYEGDMGLWSALGGSQGPDAAIITPEQARDYAVQCCEACIRSNNRWLAHYGNRLAYERAMLAAHGGTEADRNKPEKGGAVRCWASRSGGWSWIQKVNKVSVTLLDNWGNPNDKDGGRNFTRNIPFDKLAEVMSAQAVQEAREAGRLIEASDKTGFYLSGSAPTPAPTPLAMPEDSKFDAMKETLETGVQIVSAPQLFPTPDALANQLVELSDMACGDKVLEPSAGTGNLIRAAMEHGIFHGDITAVEIDYRLAKTLRNSCDNVITGDFLEQNGNLGKFDVVLMNPPFADGQDIAHIRHAMQFIEPGGRLVAICANGPRQQRELKPLAAQWIDLPAGSFSESGTNVNAAMLVINAPEAE